MRIDQYGRQILTEDDICNIFLKDPEHQLNGVLVDEPLTLPDSLDLSTKIGTQVYKPLDLTIEEFDAQCQSSWLMPESYRNMDIAQYVLGLCETDAELQRAGSELLLFQERDMFPLLCYCKYLVDTMRANNVVWGVGRGSSVSSYVLYLIGIHKVNSLYYDLSIDEFLK
jgi:DNA polymerase III alpha subunit